MAIQLPPDGVKLGVKIQGFFVRHLHMRGSVSLQMYIDEYNCV